MSILVGPPASGKTSLVRLLASLAGARLRVLPLTAATDTSDLLGGFEQEDSSRVVTTLGGSCEEIVRGVMAAALVAAGAVEGEGEVTGGREDVEAMDQSDHRSARLRIVGLVGELQRTWKAYEQAAKQVAHSHIPQSTDTDTGLFFKKEGAEAHSSAAAGTEGQQQNPLSPGSEGTDEGVLVELLSSALSAASKVCATALSRIGLSKGDGRPKPEGAVGGGDRLSDALIQWLQSLQHRAVVVSRRAGEVASELSRGERGGRRKSGGRFEWVDGPLLEAIRDGGWVLLDNANFCSPSVGGTFLGALHAVHGCFQAP